MTPSVLGRTQANFEIRRLIEGTTRVARHIAVSCSCLLEDDALALLKRYDVH